ncbi:unnamed protein product, partial [Acidithrix sp. C25]
VALQIYKAPMASKVVTISMAQLPKNGLIDFIARTLSTTNPRLSPLGFYLG